MESIGTIVADSSGVEQCSVLSNICQCRKAQSTLPSIMVGAVVDYVVQPKT